MNEQILAAWARMLGVSIPDDRLTEVMQSLEGQIAGLGGLPAEDLEEVEPAVIFEPEWNK
ncbi:MAG TPA: hypothetical protein VGU71_17210 [Candidatus Dormibacteraeota bacterium]|nr:hypothetical protein [Candidatus Dormibacteraeota bacterium]